MGHRSSQTFTDKLFEVRLAAEGAVQHRLREKISHFFLAEGDGVYWSLNLCGSVKICVQGFVFVSRFRILNFDYWNLFVIRLLVLGASTS
jgi:hypothetical protein